MKFSKGAAHIVLIALLILIPIIIVVYLVVSGRINIPGLTRKPNVKLKTQYSNPFNKDTQYVNPFQQYKNPFNNI